MHVQLHKILVKMAPILCNYEISVWNLLSKSRSFFIRSGLIEVGEGGEELLSFLLSSAPIFSSKASQRLPSSISNLIASTSACCMYSEREISNVSQIVFKTWCCCSVKFTFSLIVTILLTVSLFLLSVSMDFNDDDVPLEDGDDKDEKLFTLQVLIFNS
jgi:hypothetical protein